jgi:hypothetical protein
MPFVLGMPTGTPFRDELGLPFFPFGFYQYTITGTRDRTLPRDEAVHAMSLTAPYASTSAPTEQWWADMTAFLDEAAASGFKVRGQQANISRHLMCLERASCLLRLSG